MVVPFAGIRTFLKSPTTSTDKTKYSIVGVPYDLATTFRPGARMGPAAIRDASLMLTDGHHPRCGVDPVEMGVIADMGDVAIEVGDPKYIETIQSQISKYDFPILMGGDHSITLAGFREAFRKHGKLAVIHFDAHLDTWDGPPNHGTFMRQAVEEGLIDPTRTIQVGIRSPAPNAVWDWTKQQGIQIVPAHEVHKDMVSHTLNRIYDVVNKPLEDKTRLPVYVTFDIDCITPSECPGTGTPEVGGLFTWQVQELFNGLFLNNSTKYVGFDLMEVSPPYDVSDLTSLTAATLIWSFISYQVSQTGTI